MIMIKDKSLLIQRIKNSLSFTAVEKRYLIKAVELAPDTIEEDKDDAGDEKHGQRMHKADDRTIQKEIAFRCLGGDKD